LPFSFIHTSIFVHGLAKDQAKKILQCRSISLRYHVATLFVLAYKRFICQIFLPADQVLVFLGQAILKLYEAQRLALPADRLGG
jgi:hypothetical protein